MSVHDILVLSLFVVAPATLGLTGPGFRRLALASGLLLFATLIVLNPRGPDNPLILLPLVAIGLVAGPLIVEIVTFALRLRRKRKGNLI